MSGRTALFVFLGYALVLGAILSLTFYARGVVLANFASSDAQQQWDEWRAAAREQADEGPIRRKVPRSNEVPSLVLMRDYFGVVIAAATVFTTALYILLTIVLQGLWRGSASIRRAE